MVDMSDCYERLHADHVALMKEYGMLVGSRAAALELRDLAEARVAALEAELAAANARIKKLEALHE